MAIEIGTAYLQVVPSFKGFRTAVEQGFAGGGAAAAEQFTRDINGRLRDSRGRFVRAGQEFGEQFGEGAQRASGPAGQRSGDGFLSGLKGKAMAGITGVAVAVGAAFVDAYGEALQSRNAKVMTQAQLGVSPEQSEKLGKIAGDLYRQNYGESISGLTNDVATVFSSLKGLGSDKEIERATAKALSFGQAFEVDVTDAVQSVSTLVGSGLVKDSNEAFDLLTASAQKVPAALRENVFEASDEYSQFFRTLGFSGDEAFGALVKGAEKGEFGIDKTGDAIKEFTILSTDMSESTVGAYESIGLNATDMTDAILAGGDQAKGAFDKITDGILGIQDPAAQSQAALALFGTPLEDMNVQDIPEFLKGLKGMSGGMGDTAGAADKMDAALGSTASGIDTLWRNIKATLVDFIEQKVFPAISLLTTWIGEKLGPVVERLSTWLGENLVPTLQKVADFFVLVLVPAIQQAWQWFEVNLLPTVMRVGQFIGDTFSNLFEILGGFIDFIIGVFTGDWSRAWDGIKAIFGAIWDQIKNIVSTAWDVITGIGGKILEWLGQLAPWAWEKIKAFAGFLTEKGAEFLQWIWDGIQQKVPEVWAWFTSLPGWIWDRVAAAAAWVLERGKEFLSWLWDGIKNKAEELFGWFLSLPGWIWEKIAAAAGWVVERGGEFIGWLIQGIKNGIGTLWAWITGSPDDPSTLLGGIWNSFLTIKDKILGFGGKVVGWIVDGIKAGINAVADAITSLFDDLTFNPDGTISTPGGHVTANPFMPAAARGAVVPGRDPGRRDNMIMAVRSEESIFVPEFTRAIGGAPTVHAWNRAAEQGRLGDYLPGMARGGVVGYGTTMAELTAKKAIAGQDPWAKTILDGVIGKAKDLIGRLWMSLFGGSSITGGLNPSQDPSSFGWQRASNIVPMSYGGSQFGVAGGTEGLWKGLLDALVPHIPGGLTGPIWGYANRNIAGSGTPSFHSYGLALDVNAGQNGRGLPGYGRGGHGEIPGEIAHQLAAKFGMMWGGDWGYTDPMHFEIHVSPNQISGGGIISNIVSGIWNQATGGGGGVERWRGLGLEVLSAVGAYRGMNLTGHIDRMLNQIRTESSGNPNAINTTDCVPLDTLILTDRGWLKHDQVEVGDRTIGYNAATGCSEWTTVTRVVHYSDAPLIRVGNSRWHATTTPNHRWVTEPREVPLAVDLGDACGICEWPTGTRRRGASTAGGLRIHMAKVHGIREQRADSYGPARFVSTAGINTRDRLVLAAVADTGNGLPITDTEAAILGWLAGDGHIEEGRRGKSMSIAQSKPEMVGKLKALLADSDVAIYVDERLTRLGRVACGPRHQFRFRPSYRRDLLSRVGHPKHDAESIILRMSSQQRRLWLEAFIDAEGHVDGGHRNVSQTYGSVLDAAHLAIYLCGYRPRLIDNEVTEPGWSASATVSLNRPVVSGNFLTKEDAGSADVWCVTTDLGTWTAQQEDQIFLTGNSNAQRGDPSIGLLQVIGSTFRNALRGTPFEYLIAAGQRDPRASMTASTLYSLNRYGSLDRAWRGVAYDTGGMFAPGTLGVNMLNKPEAVLTPPETKAYQAHAKALADGYSGMVPNVQVFIGERELTEIVDVRVDFGFDEMGRQLQQAGALDR